MPIKEIKAKRDTGDKIKKIKKENRYIKRLEDERENKICNSALYKLQ